MHTLDQLIEIALKEDIGSGDITTDNLIDPEAKGTGAIITKEPLVLAGLEVFERVFRKLDSHVTFNSHFKDGDAVDNGHVIADINGNLRALLTGERTALNFLQHLSGIATNVRSFLSRLNLNRLILVDTRKTTPGLRQLEKYAVRIGGGRNHRMGLYDGVLIKDNHIAVCGGIKAAFKLLRGSISHLVKIEVETSNLTQVKDAVESGADVIMLDNMDTRMMKAAIRIIDGKAMVEVSGGITESTLADLEKIGVDIVSSGALTHSARSVDISMQIQAKN